MPKIRNDFVCGINNTIIKVIAILKIKNPLKCFSQKCNANISTINLECFGQQLVELSIVRFESTELRC